MEQACIRHAVLKARLFHQPEDHRPTNKTRFSLVINHLFLSTSLDSGLGDLASTSLVGLLNGLDDTDGDGLSHVTDSETTERRVVSESLHAHRLGWNHLDDSSITRLDELGAVLNRLAGTTINLLKELREFASNVSSVAVKNWGVTSTNLTRVVEDNDLSIEGLSSLGGIVLGVTANVTTANFLDGDVLDVEADVVTWNTLDELFVVHLNGLDFSGDTSWGEGDDHAGLDDTSLNTADRHSSNTTNLVDILKRKTERLVSWAGRRLDGVNGFEEGLAGGLASLGLLLPSLVPWAVGGDIDHVVTVETGDRNESDSLGVVADLLDEVGGLLDDFLETSLGPLGGVHLVDGNNELSDTKSESEESVLTSLAILGDTSLELTSTSGNDENGAVSLGSTSDHVLDEITMSRSVNDSNVVPGSLELPESDIDGNTTLTLSLQFVENPCVLERTLAQFGSFLLELLDGTLVNTSALVDQVTSGGRLAGIDMADNDDVDMKLLFTHVGGCES